MKCTGATRKNCMLCLWTRAFGGHCGTHCTCKTKPKQKDAVIVARAAADAIEREWLKESKP